MLFIIKTHKSTFISAIASVYEEILCGENAVLEFSRAVFCDYN
jgi:hypothetical protein